MYDCYWTFFIFSVLQLSIDHYVQDSKKNETSSVTVFLRFSAPARDSAPPRFSTPIRLQILISAPVRVSAPPSDKRPFQISLDFDQKDGEPELFLNQLTSKSLGLFFFNQYSVKYLYIYAAQK